MKPAVLKSDFMAPMLSTRSDDSTRSRTPEQSAESVLPFSDQWEYVRAFKTSGKGSECSANCSPSLLPSPIDKGKHVFVSNLQVEIYQHIHHRNSAVSH